MPAGGRRAALRRVLDAAGVDALLVVGVSSGDPDLMPFAGSARLGDCFVVVAADGRHWLGYHSPIEREEAARSGASLLDPAALGAWEPMRGGDRPGARLARSLGIALVHAGVARGRVALAGSYRNGEITAAVARLRRDGYRFESGHQAMQSLRRDKSAAQLAEMRAVAATTGLAFRRVAGVLAAATPVPRQAHAGRNGGGRTRRARGGSQAKGGELRFRGEPLTVGLLRREVASMFTAAGLDQPEGNLIAPGREGAVPHNTGNPATVLRASESLIVDLFPRRQLHADCTRTFCVGTPPAVLMAAHGAVLGALELAQAGALPGVTGISIQEAVWEYFEARGYATTRSDRGTTSGYVHGLGHGVGFEVHELPHFRAGGEGGEGTLRRGDVFTLEPGLYDPAAGYGVRLEDLYVLGARGLENLTPLPYDLDPRAWPRDDAARPGILPTSRWRSK